MAAPSDFYVDPNAGVDDPGTAGTIGDPYKSLQYAFDDATFDATNGTRFNVKAGTTDTTADTTLVFANQTAAAPMYVQGFTTAAGDGGRGHIDTGTAKVNIGYSYLHYQDMEFTCTSSTPATVGAYSNFFNCVLNCNASVGATQARMIACTVIGVLTNIGQSYFNKVTHSSGTGITSSGTQSVVAFNQVFSNTGATSAIILTGHNAAAINNSCYASATVATAIHADDASYKMIATNNLVEGYTTAFKTATNTNEASMICNSSYGETTLESFSADPLYQTTSFVNESLGASPFTSAGTGDLTPVSTGSVLSGFGIGTLARGAIIPATGGGGGGLKIIGTGGLVG